MSQLLPSRDEENRMWQRLEQQRSMRESAARQVTPQGYQNLTGMQRAYPHLATGTKVSLAQAGVAPDDPLMAAVVEADQRVKKKKGFGWHSIGDTVSAGGNLIGKPLAAVANSVLRPVGGAVADAARPVIRTGIMALSAPFEEAGGLLRNVASSGPGRSGEIGAGVAGGAAAGAGIGGILGSVVPVLGNVIGAGTGALVGGAIGGIAGMLAPEVEGEAQWASQSQLGMAATQLLQNKKVEAGSGWFANAETGLGQAQEERAIKAAAIKGKGGVVQGWTIGRSVADVIAEPGTSPYNILSGLIDASAAIKLDPASAALKGRNLSPTKYGSTLRALKKDGLIDGARKTILPEKVTELLDHSEFGADLKKAIATETSPFRISKMFKGQLDHNPDALNALARTSTPEEAAAALRPVLGADAAKAPLTELRRGRITRLIPGVTEDKALVSRQMVAFKKSPRLEYDKPADLIRQVDSYMAIAKVPEADRLAAVDEVIASLSGPNTGRLPALEAVAKAVGASVKAHGADDATARKLSQLFAGSVNDARNYTAGTIADGELLPGMIVGGEGVGLKSPFMINEFLNHGVTLPDQRELSNAVRLVKAFNHPLAGNTVEGLSWTMGLWKSTAVLRPATTLRILGDSQARMMAAGYKGLNHPFQFISRAVADKKGNVIPAVTGEPAVDAEIFQGGINRISGSAAFRDKPTSYRNRERIALDRDGPELFKQGWANDELSRLHTDPIARQLARLRRTGNSAAQTDEAPEVAAAFDDFDDPVKTAVIDMTGRGPGYASIDELKQSFWDGPLSKQRKDLQAMEDDTAILASRAESDAYVDQINVWIDDFTRNDDRLLDYVQRGPNKVKADKVTAAMDELIEGGNRPDLVVGSRTIGGDATEKTLLDKGLDAMFDVMHTRPDNFFSRSPVLHQDMYRNIERMLPALDEADKAGVIRRAEQAKMDPDTIARLKERAKVPFDGERMSLEDVDFIAQHQAVDNMKDLLYDISKRGKWADATRLIFPFAEPWKEALTIWPKLLAENPAAVRRLDQTIQGARGSGFFQKDPNTGEEMFVYPGSAFISKMIVGAPIPIRGSASGLNLFSSSPVMPGAGPLVQIAAGKLLPDKPEYDWVRDAVSPFGRTDTSGGFVESFMPAWAQKLRKFTTSGEGDRMFNNTVYDMARYLVSTGEYSIDTPEGQEATTDAAVSMAKRMYLLRAGASFVSPSAPSPEMIAQDTEGRVITQFALMEEYRALQQDPGTKTKVNGHEIEGVGYDSATAEFLGRYGDGALLMMQPKTKGGGAPLDDTMDWIRDNPDLARRYEDVYQYFAPHSGEFSQTAYERQLATGERHALTPSEAMEAANSRVASMLMRTAKSKVGAKTSDGERKWLADVQAALIEEYAGYNPQSFDPGKTPAAIRQLEDAMAEPKMAESKNGQAISLYLQARAKAQEAAEAQGVKGFQKAKSARPIRDWLRAVGAAITEETPEFSAVWDQLLSRELTSDIEATTSA